MTRGDPFSDARPIPYQPPERIAMTTGPVALDEPADGPYFENIELSIELARYLLDHQEENRHLRPKKVAKMARDIKAGKWKQSAEPIKLNPAGRMIDGQHRCAAVVTADMAIKVTLARNVPNDARPVLDSGIPRSAGDNLTMDGYQHGPRLAAITAKLIDLDRGRKLTRAYDISISEILDFVAAHPETQDATALSRRYERQLAISPSLIGTAIYVIATAPFSSFELAEQFFDAAAEKIGLYPGDPVLAMCNHFDDPRIRRQKEDLNGQLSVILRAFNYRIAGRELKRIHVNSNSHIGGLVPIPAVQVPQPPRTGP